jgi:hypothetical protein
LKIGVPLTFIEHTAPRMIGRMTIRSSTPKIMIRYDHLRQNDNYLDEKIKRVSARQTETPEVLWKQDGQGLS